MTPRSRRRLRWLVPASVVAATVAVTIVPDMLPAGADPVPVLPALTPAQLLEKVHSTRVPSVSGDIAMNADLGLPDLSSLGVRSGTLLDLLNGRHTAHVAYDGPTKVRLALDGPQSERDWIRNGADLWSWDSTTQVVQHTTVDSALTPDEATADAAARGAASLPAIDPVAAANEVLAKVDPSTAVTVETPGYVAGRPVYELVVAPRSAASTIADAVVSVDAATGLPLAVRIDPKGASKPAISVEFTSISFDQPAASTFAFTPPPGATVDEVSSPDQMLPLGGFGQHGPRGDRHRTRSAVNGSTGPSAALVPGTSTPRASGPGDPHVTTVGTAWDTVGVITNLQLGRQIEVLTSGSPAVTVGSTTGHVVTTRLVNVLVLDDGRLLIGAVSVDALVAAAG